MQPLLTLDIYRPSHIHQKDQQTEAKPRKKVYEYYHEIPTDLAYQELDPEEITYWKEQREIFKKSKILEKMLPQSAKEKPISLDPPNQNRDPKGLAKAKSKRKWDPFEASNSTNEQAAVPHPTEYSFLFEHKLSPLKKMNIYQQMQAEKKKKEEHPMNRPEGNWTTHQEQRYQLGREADVPINRAYSHLSLDLLEFQGFVIPQSRLIKTVAGGSPVGNDVRGVRASKIVRGQFD